MLTITRKLEFDAGHRIPNHKSECRNVHGHRYVMHITLSGQVQDEKGASSEGMLMDFSDVKRLAETHLVSLWDHAFLVYEGDTAVRGFLDTLPDHKTVVLDRIPTVENLARIAFDTLKTVYENFYDAGLTLQGIKLYETPNSWAEVTAASTSLSNG
ncbi:6-carboxytetrahydropterin synthase QueD [Oxalobacter sp. OttesenSCG-928-P03]|nr:6-carboxytetrahydropterin synthase QueD [Oxalobacter sp. OttesenSCG-928-P03]